MIGESGGTSVSGETPQIVSQDMELGGEVRRSGDGAGEQVSVAEGIQLSETEGKRKMTVKRNDN